MRRIYLIFILLLTIVQARSALIEYSHVIPENNAVISSFDIRLVFDISNLIAENGDNEYGIGHAGYYFEGDDDINKSTALYEGTGDSKVLLSRIFTSNVNGQSDDFEIGNEVLLSFPGCIPSPGKQYTIVVNNNFDAYIKGVKSKVKNTNVAFMEDPLILTFVGGTSSSEILSIEECSILNGSQIAEFSEVCLTFNRNVKAIEGMDILLSDKDQNEIHSTNIEVDGRNLVATFEPQFLLNGREYFLQIPSGLVQSDEDASLRNSALNITINGAGFYKLNIENVIPAIDETALPSEITATFNLPTEYKLMTNMGERSNFNANLYKFEVCEDNLLSSINGKISEDGKSLTWNISEVFVPETKYVLYVPANQFSAWNYPYEDYINNEIKLEFTTPSLEEAGFAPMEFGTPIIGKHGVSNTELNCKEAIASLSTIEIALKDFDYYLDGKKQILFYCNEASNRGYIYDITSGEEVLVKEFSNSLASRENIDRYYTVISAIINENFFDGHRYRIVLPEGTYTISETSLKNYIFNSALIYEFDGATPEQVELINCSLEDGATRTSLSSVAYEFKGTFKLREGATALYKGNVTSWDIPVSVSYSGGNTKLLANCVNSNTGEPFELSEGREYAVTLPAGILYYEANPELANEEIVRTFIGKVAPVVVEPEFVNLEVEINGFHTTGLEAVKDRKASVKLIPDENWKIDEILRDGNPVTDWYDVETGTYTTPKLTSDSKIQATIEYKHDLVFADIATGIAELPNSNVRIYNDGNDIVIEGLSGGESIEVYSIAGMVIGKHIAVEDTIRISAISGQYIVRVNSEAAKIIH